MSVRVVNSGTVRFGAFEADLRSGELRKDGIKVKLEGQPFRVLAVLLGRPGQLVTREELQTELWPGETFVDFEQGINAAVKRLRVALEDSAETPRFIETLPRRGYRFIERIEIDAHTPPVEEGRAGPILPAAEAAHTQNIPSVVTREATVRWRRIMIGLAAIAAVLLLALALNPGGWRDRLLGRPRAGEITSIAVLPLENLTGDPQQDYFVDGMTEALITQLGKISSLRVISRTSAMAYKGAKKPLPEIARELGVDAVLEGAVARNGDRVRITARVIHLSQERTLLAESYERDLREISGLQSEIVLAVADEIRVKLLDQEQVRLARVQPVNPRAYEAYLMGRSYQARRNPEGMRKALTYFQRALEIDAGYAPAYVGIMDCYAIGGGRQMPVSIKEANARMKAAAQKVIELDGGAAAAHYAQALLKWREWDFPKAEQEFRRALDMNPGDVHVRQQYAHFLLGMHRPEDARQEIRLAIALDPLSPMFIVDVGITYLYTRQFREAIEQGEKALAMEKDYPYARGMLGSAYWYQGKIEDALAVGWPNPNRPERNHFAKQIYERGGIAALNLAMRTDVEQRNPSGSFDARSAEVALWYAITGDKEKTFAWLEKAYQERDPWLPLDLAKPPFDRFRSEQGFHNLLRRIGLPQ